MVKELASPDDSDNTFVCSSKIIKGIRRLSSNGIVLPVTVDESCELTQQNSDVIFDGRERMGAIAGLPENESVDFATPSCTPDLDILDKNNFSTRKYPDLDQVKAENRQ
jgi:hypothetical protein